MFANMHSYIPTLNLNAIYIIILNSEKEVGIARKHVIRSNQLDIAIYA